MASTDGALGHGLFILKTFYILDKYDPDELDVSDFQYIALQDSLFELLKPFESLQWVFALFPQPFEADYSSLISISTYNFFCEPKCTWLQPRPD